MAQPQQQIPPQPQIPNSTAQEPAGRILVLTSHFWTPNTTSFMKIGDMVDQGTNYDQEAPYQNMIVAVLTPYFPTVQMFRGGPVWSVDRESYRGPPGGPSTQKPDAIAVRMTPFNPTSSQSAKRDFLWVEVKPANHDKPSGWKDLLAETAIRMNSAHPTRSVYVLLVVGVKFMILIWDAGNTITLPPAPQQPGQPQQPVQAQQPVIHSAGAPARTWNVDPRFKFPFRVPYHNHLTGVINTAAASSLDCRAVYPANQKPAGRGPLDVLRYENDLATLEQFLVALQQAPLQGNNPGHFF